MNPRERCPCGSGRAYEQCCLRWHSGDPAPTAQALMRSRYSAFVLRNEPYLLATWHESKRPSTVEFDLNQKWLGLTIVDSDATDATSAEVEFIARYRIGGASAARLHERSRFMKEGDRWYYVDGTIK
jgi:SEC-C motif-containing protein